MSVAAAQAFIRRALIDPALIESINAAADRAAVEAILADHHVSLTGGHFEHAFISLLLTCQTEEQAESVKAVKLWWDYLQFALDAPPGGSSPA